MPRHLFVKVIICAAVVCRLPVFNLARRPAVTMHVTSCFLRSVTHTQLCLTFPVCALTDHQEDLQHNGRWWHGGRQRPAPQHALTANCFVHLSSAAGVRGPFDAVQIALPQDVDKQGKSLSCHIS